MTRSDPPAPVHASTPPGPSPMDVQSAVAHSADAAELFATAPALLLELQSALGALAGSATTLTGRGRRPFRPDAGWADRLGELAYRLYLLADQTGVPLDRHVYAEAERVYRHAQQQAADRPAGDDGWPVRGG